MSPIVLHILFCFCMCMSVWSRVCQSECVQIRGQSGPSTMWAFRIALRTSSLVARTFTHRAVSLFIHLTFLRQSLVPNLELAGSARLAGQ